MELGFENFEKGTLVVQGSVGSTIKLFRGTKNSPYYVLRHANDARHFIQIVIIKPQEMKEQIKGK